MKNKQDKPKPTVTLLTNISSAQYQDIRLQCHSVILELNYESIFSGSGLRIRGFGTDGAWPVFDTWANNGVTVTLEPFTNNSIVMMKEEGILEPIFTGNKLILSDGRFMSLYAEDFHQPIDRVDNLTNYDEIWRLLHDRVSAYWQAPYMPSLTWGPPKVGSWR